jgi:hypothetical protein
MGISPENEFFRAIHPAYTPKDSSIHVPVT